jgi:hypothetical protein
MRGVNKNSLLSSVLNEVNMRSGTGIVFRIVICMVGVFYVGHIKPFAVLKGSVVSGTKTFDFPVGPVSFVQDVGGMNMIFAGADQEKVGNEYAVSQYVFSVDRFIPLAVEKVTLNNVPDQINPLYGARIKCLKSLQKDMTSVLATLIVDRERVNDPQPSQECFSAILPVVFTLDNNAVKVCAHVVQSDVPNDSAGNPIGYMKGLTTGQTVGENYSKLLIAPVTELDKAFGEGNSGFALAQFVEKKDGETTTYHIEMLDGNTGTLGNNAVLFNNTIDAIRVGSNPTIIVNDDVYPVIDMYLDGALKRLYIALCIKSAEGLDNGARALAVARFDGKKLIIDRIVPDVAVLGVNNTIVSACNGRSASLYKVRTMHTSTRLSYLIVNGGNNPSDTTGVQDVANRIYALPLTDLKEKLGEAFAKDKDHGVLANVKKDPVVTFITEGSNRFVGRSFEEPAKASEELFTHESRQAVVGAGPLPLIPGVDGDKVRTIKDMFVLSDAVYVTVAADYDSVDDSRQEPGIFQSRAIFDEQGRIAAWTPWVRVGGSDFKIHSVCRDSLRGDFWYNTASDDGEVDTFIHGGWGVNAKDGLLGGTKDDENVGLIHILEQAFPTKNGGLQSATSFSSEPNEKEIPYSGLSGITTLLASGYKKIVFVKTGDDNGKVGTIKPHFGDFSKDLAVDMHDTFPQGDGHAFVITGPVIDSIGSIGVHVVFSDNTQSWIAVGGSGGVAVLSNEDGSGFKPIDMPTGFTFKKIGNFSFVKKIIGVGDYVYVLTADELVRININPQSFIGGDVPSVTLATPKDMNLGSNGSFADIVIAHNFAVLATSRGLFRIANGSSIKAIVPRWTYVPLKEDMGPVISVSHASSSTKAYQGLAEGGQLYVLSANQSFDDTRLYRFYVHENGAISDTTLQPIGDQFVRGTLSYFASFGQYINSVFPDGSVHYITRPIDCGRSLLLRSLPAFVRVANASYAGNECVTIHAGLPEVGTIKNVLRLDASGALLVYGNFVRVNE